MKMKVDPSKERPTTDPVNEDRWNSFFRNGPPVTKDFERPEQGRHSIREGFDDKPFSLSEEDHTWLRDKPVGREEI